MSYDIKMSSKQTASDFQSFRKTGDANLLPGFRSVKNPVEDDKTVEIGCDTQRDFHVGMRSPRNDTVQQRSMSLRGRNAVSTVGVSALDKTTGIIAHRFLTYVRNDKTNGHIVPNQILDLRSSSFASRQKEQSSFCSRLGVGSLRSE